MSLMGKFKALIFLFLSAPLLWAQGQEKMMALLREATAVSKDTAKLEADWRESEAELKAKLKVLEALKKRLEDETGELKERSKKESELERDLKRRLAEAEAFELKLSDFLSAFARDFEAEASKNRDTKAILSGVIAAMNSGGADAYSRACDFALALQKALDLSRGISPESALEGRYLRLGVSALISAEKSEGAESVLKMLDGERPYDFVELELPKRAKEAKK